MSLPQRILVTGGAGFIGSHVVDRLSREGHDIHVIDDLSSGRRVWLPAGVTFTKLDLADKAASALVAGWRPDTIIHCAAQVSVAGSVRDPGNDARTNVLGTINLLQGAQSWPATRFVYVTTGGALYGEPATLPIREDDPIAPLSPYGLSKWAGERYVELLLPRSSTRVTLRLANVYGPRQTTRGEAGVVAIFVGRMLRAEPVQIHGDGRQTRDFVYVDDVAEAVVRAADCAVSATLNIGTGIGTEVRGLFLQTAALTSFNLAPEYVAARPGDIRNSVLAPDRARVELDWKATTPLERGLARTIAWARTAQS